MFEKIKNPEEEFEQKVKETAVLVESLFKEFNSGQIPEDSLESLRFTKRSEKRESFEYTKKGDDGRQMFYGLTAEYQKKAENILNNLIEISEIKEKGRKLPPTRVGNYIAGEYNGALRGSNGQINIIGETRQFCITDNLEVAKREILEPLQRMMELYKEDIEKFAHEKQK
jgi:hypothetical protein